MLVAIMSSSMAGIPMVVKSDAKNSFNGKTPLRGAVIIAFDPATMVDPEDFKKQNGELLAYIQKSQALPGKQIRIPGVEAGKRKAASEANQTVDIPEKLWQEIKELRV